VVFEPIDEALLPSPRGHDLSAFAVSVLEGINLLLAGAGCLILSLGMFSLFVKPLRLPPVMPVERFHSLKGRFANVVILARAVSVLESLSNLSTRMRDAGGNGRRISLLVPAWLS
jgi:uncharacterized membrane protein YqhA